MSHRKLEPGKLVVASHNKGKLREINELLQPYGFEVVSAGDLGLPEPEETGTTFEANAEIKAVASATAANLPALADDSGFCVAELNGDPGIYSARWAGPDKDFAMAMRTWKKNSNRPGQRHRSAAAARLSRCCVWPGRMGTRSSSVVRWMAKSSGRRAALKALATIRCFSRTDMSAPLAK
jgi:XTP/dITP diphosphohydrolase